MTTSAARRYLALSVALVAAATTAAIIGFSGPRAGSTAAESARSAAPDRTTHSPFTSNGWASGTVAVRPAFGGTITVIAPGGKPLPIAVGTQISGLAAAPAGTPRAGTLFATDSTTGELFAVVPPGRVEKLAEIGGAPDRVVVVPAGAPDAGDLYVLDGAGAFVTIVGPDGTVRRTVGVGEHPTDVGFTAGRALVLARGSGAPGSPGSVTAITPTAVLPPIPTGTNSTSMAVAPDGSSAAGTIYVTNAGDGTLTVIEPGGVRRVVAGFHFPTVVLTAPRRPDGTDIVYLVDGPVVRILDAAGHPRGEVPLAGDPTRPAIAPLGTPDAGRLYAGVPAFAGVIAVDPGGRDPVRAATGPLPISVAVAPGTAADAGDVYVLDRAAHTLTRLRPSGRVAERVPLADAGDDLVMVGAPG